MLSKKTRKVDVCLSPLMIDLFDLKEKTVVVIDVFRATTAMCVFFKHHGDKVIPVSSLDQAEFLKKKLDNNKYTFAAERNGKIVESFDFGNSPVSYDGENFRNKSLVITTTNGTKAIEKSKKAGHGVLIASFLNVGSVVRSLVKDFKNDVLVFCSGWKGRFCIEDTLLAGMIVNKLLDHNFKYESDSAAMSYNVYENNKSNLMSAVEKSAYMNRLNLVNDIRYCMQIDTMSLVPSWKNLKFEDKLDFHGFLAV